MTALVGVFGPGAAAASDVLPQMFSTMRGRATSEPERVASTGVLIAAARHPWESELPGWSGPLILENERWIVAADASLYYVRDLRRQLTRAPHGTDSGELLLSALDQWGGARFARHVEGDYAVIVWDKRERRAFLARDFSARRILVYAVAGETLVVATSPLAVVRHPAVSSEYDEVLIATSAATLPGHGERTAYRHVTRLAGGSTLAFREGRLTEVDRWVPQPFGAGFEDELSDAAAEELLSLIEQATMERLGRGPTAVWMSGGWDSPSVFAAGMSALSRSTNRSQELRLISMTYPADDIGNEDEHIRAIAGRWRSPVSWVDTENVPLVSDSQRRARLRDDPMIHPFESLNRRMAQLTIELGSRVALDGFGGDHLFDMSALVVPSDHLFHGRWDHLWREWRQSRRFRAFARGMLVPMFSEGLRDWIGTVRGRPLADGWARPIPDWITGRPEVRDQIKPESDVLPGESPSQYASRMLVCSSFISRAVSWNHAFGLDEGVQIRSPLFDTRLISWAAARPLSDRAAWGEGKRMLRRAMKGLIPESVLAPRGRKTGTPAGYFKRQFQNVLPARFNQLFGAGGSHLGAMGIIEEDALKSAVAQYLQTGDHILGAGLFMTMEAEHWLVTRRTEG